MINLIKYPIYKKIKNSYIDNIPEDWEEKRLNSISKILNGATPSSNISHYWNGNITWVTPTDINKITTIFNSERSITTEGYNSCGTFLVPKETIIMTTRAPIGKLVIAGTELCTNQGCKSIIPQENYNHKFIYFQLLINTDKLNSLGTGTTFMELSNKALKNLFLTFPSTIEEQTKIANYLEQKTEQIDKAITQKNELIKLLKERQQILINDAITKGINNTVQMKESNIQWLGEIPEHWEIRKVKHVFNLIIDPAPQNNNFELLSIYTDIGVKPRKDLDEKGNKASTTDGYWKVSKGDFIVNKLLAWMGAIGISNYNGVTSPAYDILRAKELIDGVYYHELFRMKVFTQEMKKHSKGIMDMRLRLYFNKFGDIRIPFPPFKEQQSIINFIKENNSKIDKAINLQEQQIERLKELKETLIDSCVTGKVKVP